MRHPLVVGDAHRSSWDMQFDQKRRESIIGTSLSPAASSAIGGTYNICYIAFDTLSGARITASSIRGRHAMRQASVEVPGDYSVRVRSLRGCIELTQVQLANRIGVSFATVNRWENGQCRPTRLAWQQILELEDQIATSEGGIEPAAAPAETPSAFNFAARPSVR